MSGSKYRCAVEKARSTWKRTGLDVLVTPKGIQTDKNA